MTALIATLRRTAVAFDLLHGEGAFLREAGLFALVFAGALACAIGLAAIGEGL